MDLRQSKEWGNYLEGLGWESSYFGGGKEQIALRIRKVLFFAVTKVQRPESLSKEVISEIEETCRKKRALFVKIEPKDKEQEELLIKCGYRKDSWPTVPPKTIIIDLSKEDFLRRFSKTAKQSIKKADAEGIEIDFYKPSDEKSQKELFELMKNTAKRAGFFVSSLTKDYKYKFSAFDKNGFFVFARKEGMPLCGAFVIVIGDTAYYLHAGSLGGKASGEAPYKLIAKTLEKVKEEGVKYFDLEGIYDERYQGLTRKWKNFTIFKMKLGGDIVEYPGSYTKNFNLLSRIF